MMKYSFREPLTLMAADKADAQKIGEELNKLAGAVGELTPAVVVETARSPRNILHRHFQWDDQKAAEAFRLDQARCLIRSIVVEDDEAEDGNSQAFISISDKGGTSYRTLTAVKNSADLQAKVLAAAQRDLTAWERRYRSLADVCKVVRKAQEMIERKRERQAEKETRAQA
jgi:hypothetical protein